jgi:cell division septum initiation protein DivIVA
VTAGSARFDAVDTETLLRRVIDIISATRALPLSSSVKLDNKEEVLGLLEDACARLPDELREARLLRRERDQHLARTRREADELVAAARNEAQQMVQRTQIFKEAESAARRVVEEAREEARRLRLDAEDYCDQKLASFEIVLDRTMKTVVAGREKLASAVASAPTVPVADEGDATGEGFFDQDRWL